MALTTKVAPTPARDALTARNGARWFYWIAGLSVLNSVVAVMGTSFMMLFGLTSTLFVTYVGINFGGAGTIIGVVVTALVSLGFVGLGWMAERGARWAFITGLALYAVDGLVTLYIRDWLAALAHVAALVIVTMGMLASQRLARSGVSLAIQPGADVATGAAVPAPLGAAPIPGQMPLPSAAPPSSASPGFAEAKAPAPLD